VSTIAKLLFVLYPPTNPLHRGAANSLPLFYESPPFSACSNDVGLCTPHNEPLPEGRGSPLTTTNNSVSQRTRYQEPIFGYYWPVTASWGPRDIR
jgi:hypothetical protein